MSGLLENDLEEICCELLQEMGFDYAHGDTFDPLAGIERENYHTTFLVSRLKAAAARINSQVPADAIDSAVNKVLDAQLPDLIQENRRIHHLITDGIPVEYTIDGETIHDRAFLVDWEDELNEWLAVNQFTVVGKNTRRPDIVIFLNGMPLVVIELKGPESQAGIDAAFNQIQTYKGDIPELFRSNSISVISDGLTARYGTISADFERFMRWRTIDGETLVENGSDVESETLFRGLLQRDILLSNLRSFTVFEDDGVEVIKKVGGYHQFYAGQRGFAAVKNAIKTDGRAGVFWHTQGSGKSLLMVFLAGLLIKDPALENPTILVLTDRNDLDNQLFTTFSRCRALFGQEPTQADSVSDLIEKLDRKVGGVVFSTIQKFHPEDGGTVFETITNRKNVIVFVDEAHRTQYGFAAKIDRKTGEKSYGYAHYLRQALPHAAFVGFTGTPVELVDRNTITVFGDYIDVYDIARAVEDGATVPIYYEAKIVRLTLADSADTKIDEAFCEITEGMGEDEASRVGGKWARVEALAGAKERIKTLAKLVVDHFEQRQEALDGKGMVVCMSRRICVELYDEIGKLRPDWLSDDDSTGAMKVVMTGSAADPSNYQKHIRTKTGVDLVAKRFRNPKDSARLVIVRDMFLTGFDSPALHTIYIDKPMEGHTLMQAITRVNRVFAGKPAGLVVDTIGIGAELKAALACYSPQDKSLTGIDIEKAVVAFRQALEVMRSMFHSFDYSKGVNGKSFERLQALAGAADFVFGLEAMDKKETSKEERTQGVKRFMDAVLKLDKAFKLASGRPETEVVKDEVGFFCAVRTAIRKILGTNIIGKSAKEVDAAIEALVNQSVVSTEIIDILKAAGMERPDISVLSEEFLDEIKNLKRKNLAVEALRKLLAGQIKSRTRTNLVKNQAFSQQLADAMARYHNRVVDAVQVINELIAIAKHLREEPEDGLTSDEVAFYDALANNKSAIEVMGNETLRLLAAELVTTIRNNSGVDWWRFTARRTKIRVEVKRLLKKYGYPPDLTEEAVKTVVQQAETIAAEMRQAA